MIDRVPVTTLAELDALNSDEMVEGYLAGFYGEAEPGNNRSKAYWHGWRNGTADRTKTSDWAQQELARLIVARSRLKGDKKP